MLFINRAHESCCGGEDLVDEDEDGFLGGELDALPDDVDELAYSQVLREQKLVQAQ